MRQAPTFAEAIFKLLGHVLGGALLFLALAAVSWAIGWSIDLLHRIRPFEPTVFELLHLAELFILYLDVALSSIVLLVGAYRFVREITGAAR